MFKYIARSETYRIPNYLHMLSKDLSCAGALADESAHHIIDKLLWGEWYMWLALFFRGCLALGFLYNAWRWGDWKNRGKYYPTVLFTMVVDLAASYLTYHHMLWNYNPDILIKTQTTIEMLNAFVVLPAVTFTFLSLFPSNNKFDQCRYVGLWVLIFSGIEFIDHYIVGSISYQNGWSWSASLLFDCAIFPTLRLHYAKPIWAWLLTALLTAIILVVFNFDSAEMK